MGWGVKNVSKVLRDAWDSSIARAIPFFIFARDLTFRKKWSIFDDERMTGTCARMLLAHFVNERVNCLDTESKQTHET